MANVDNRNIGGLGAGRCPVVANVNFLGRSQLSLLSVRPQNLALQGGVIRDR
jgi:hypothetical protein